MPGDKMATIKKMVIIAIVSLIIDFSIISVFYNQLPEKVVTHFSGNYVPDNFREKSFLYIIWGIKIPLWIVVIGAFGLIKGTKIKYFPPIHFIVAFYLAIMHCFSTSVIIFFSLNPDFQSHWIISALEWLIVAIVLSVLAVRWYFNYKAHNRR